MPPPQFYLCAAGVPHLISCRPGTLYSAALMTCDHAANVDCQPQAPPEEDADNEEEEDDDDEDVEEEEDSSPVPVPLPVPTIVTLAPAKSTVRTVTTPRTRPTVRTVPTVPTVPARPKPTRRPTYRCSSYFYFSSLMLLMVTSCRPRPTPVTAKDETPLEEVDNSLDHVSAFLCFKQD